MQPDPATRNALSRQAQEIVRADVPYAVLITQPRIEGVRAGKVKNHTLHPSDFYLIDNRISVEYGSADAGDGGHARRPGP